MRATHDTSPRDPQAGVLHRVLREHLETFLAARASADPEGVGLPPFVTNELRAFLRCGVLAHGAARFRCDDCRRDRLVALSCKGRGFCPRCGGRRMTDLAGHLVSRVFPEVRVRQWVLTLPFGLRYRAAYDHSLALAIWRVAVRVIDRWYRRSVRCPAGARLQGGSVTAIHRFGGDLRLNLHFHGVFLDGAFALAPGRAPRFVPVAAPAPGEMEALLAKIVTRVERLLARRDGGASEAAGQEGPLAHTLTRSVLSRGASKLGPDEDPHVTLVPERERRKARLGGFDLDATVAVSPRRRDRLEQLCRYILRPPFSASRLRAMPDGRIVLALRHPWPDGTTHVAYEPDTFLERLASLVPRPRANTLLYHGILAGHASHRARALPGPPGPPRRRNTAWADLMRKSFGLDVLSCRDCGGRMRYVAALIERSGLARALRAHGYRCEALPIRPARPPPGPAEHDWT